MTRTHTTCPFCLNGCESEVVFDYQYRMEYPVGAAVNQGRLCPRGNSASIVVDHPQRLGYPLLDGHEVGWDQAMSYFRKALEVRPEELAVAYSRGLTDDELGLVNGFARTRGTQNLVCGYLEPGNAFGLGLEAVKQATLNDVRQAKTTLLVGDVFGTSPVAAGPILDARYADRKNRVIVVDSIRTRQSGFAHLFVQVRPGAEPLALLAMAAALDRKLGLDAAACAKAAGVEPAVIEAAANMLKAGPAFVGCAMTFGRCAYPELHSLASQLVAAKAGASFTGFAEARLAQGPMSFGSFRQALCEKRVRTVCWFGALYPLSYPEVMPEASNVEFRVATSIFRPAQSLPGLLLPVPSELEKSGRGRSYWGEVSRVPLAGPYSGTRTVSWILGELGSTQSARPEAPQAVSVEKLRGMVDTVLGQNEAGGGVTLLGEKSAAGVAGFFDAEDWVRVSAQDAKALGLQDGTWAELETRTRKTELHVCVSESVPAGVAAVGVNRHESRALFPLSVGKSGWVAVGPAAATLRPSGRQTAPVPERRAS